MCNRQSICYRPIGIIRVPIKDPKDIPRSPLNGQHITATIEIFPEFAAGLKDIEGFSHLILLYHLHLSKDGKLLVKPRRARKVHGVFTTRSPNRPNPIGLSVVRLLKVEANLLHVQNVDFVDGTPLLDIKPYIPEVDQADDIRIGWLQSE
ncbi:MAG: tRNA (N6-threonylcarbamoyladenosine(37)-N6)-methyltransferase TrmO [Calditrichaeota bacterium]|nr:tRNA (N6-threonylcarbamoyladenosine(37)-N6)-methyltransferase TrmO [Calditrichota bacterium]